MGLTIAWELTPRLNVSGTYSDNILLAPSGEEESGSVVEVNPGFSVQRQSRRLTANIDYNMRNLYYDNRSEFDTRHQLQGTASLEVIRERFFIDTSGSISQVNNNATSDLGADVISSPAMFDDVFSFAISPRWISRFDDIAELRASYQYRLLRTDSDSLGDSDIHTLELALEDGDRFANVGWALNYSRQLIDRAFRRLDNTTISGDEDSLREKFDAQAEYKINDEWAAAARAGFRNSDLSDASTGIDRDGSFWSLGGLWTPSRFIGGSFFYGPRDNELAFSYSPSARTTFSVSRRDRDVGLDSGVIWTGSLEHRSRYTTWLISYLEGNTSGELTVIESPFLTFDDEQTGTTTIFNDQGEVIEQQNRFSLTSGDFDRQQLSVSMSYSRARTRFLASSFYEKRTFFDFADNEETAYGARLTLQRALGGRTVSALSTYWQRNETTDTNLEADLLAIQGGIVHALTRDVAAGLSYRYAQRDTNVQNQDFTENRLRAVLRLQF